MPALPTEVLTPRLVLRAVDPAHAAAVNEALRESQAELQAWMEWAHPAPTVADTAAYLERAGQEFAAGRGYAFAAFRRDGGRFAVMVGLETIDWPEGRADLGYWTRTSETGRGYATEAVAEVLRLGFAVLGLRRVEARIAAGNVRSRRVAETLGFVHDPAFDRHAPRPDGTPDVLRLYVRNSPPGPHPA